MFDQDRDDAMYELNARYDWAQETFGSYCQTHRVHYGAECPRCLELADTVADFQTVTESGSAVVNREARKSVMFTLMQAGFKVVAVGNMVRWTR